MQLNLTDTEVAMLREVLESNLTELRSEIFHTDTREFRDRLHEREASLRHVLDMLGGAPASEASGM